MNSEGNYEDHRATFTFSVRYFVCCSSTDHRPTRAGERFTRFASFLRRPGEDEPRLFAPPPVPRAEDGTVMRLLYDASRAEGLRLYAPGDVCKHPGGRTVKAMSVFRESERSYVVAGLQGGLVGDDSAGARRHRRVGHQIHRARHSEARRRGRRAKLDEGMRIRRAGAESAQRIMDAARRRAVGRTERCDGCIQRVVGACARLPYVR